MANGNYTVVTTMKNESPYILEWVAHHKALGFNNIVIATNDSTDPTVAILSRLEKIGDIRMHKTIIRSGGIQMSALRQATRRYEEAIEADWLYICDSDEFLNIKVGDGSVDALIDASSSDVDVISVPWRVFGPAGINAIQDQPTTEQFMYRENYAETERKFPTGKFKKSIYRNFDKFRRPGVHAPLPSAEYEDKINVELPGKTENVLAAFEVAQVNHYAIRSLDAYLVKRDRGRVNHTNQTMGLDYWHRYNLSHQFDDSIARYRDAIKSSMAGYLSDPELSHLQKLSIEWFQERADAMKNDPELVDIIEEMKKTNFIDPKDDQLIDDEPMIANEAAK